QDLAKPRLQNVAAHGGRRCTRLHASLTMGSRSCELQVGDTRAVCRSCCTSLKWSAHRTAARLAVAEVGLGRALGEIVDRVAERDAALAIRRAAVGLALGATIDRYGLP